MKHPLRQRYSSLPGHEWSLQSCLGTFVCTALLMLSLPATMLFAEDDAIYEKCMSQRDDPAPWCYQQEVERSGDPDLCENILEYWPRAEGVHGQCYYQLAVQKKDCELCKRIKDKDIRRMCELDVCK